VDPTLGPTLLKLALPCVAIGLIVFAARRRGLTGSDGFGLVRPRAGGVLLWVGIWAVWVAIGEIVGPSLGLDAPRPWVGYTPLVVALRILAIGVAGPVVEELAMRGVVLWRLRTTRLGVAGAILVSAIAWALMHLQYGAASIAMIALDGVLLGTARQKTGSLGAPIAMHVLGNLFSIGQSLGCF
jgi:CAAX protease family protein